MTTKQMFQALKCIAPRLCIDMTASGEGRWYLANAPEISTPNTLSGIDSYAETPEGAINKAWVEIQGKILCSAYGSDRRAYYTWNGFMWRETERAS